MKSIMLVTDDDIEKNSKGRVVLSCCSDEIKKAEPYFDIIIYEGEDEIAIWKNRYGVIKSMRPNNSLYDLLRHFSSSGGCQ